MFTAMRVSRDDGVTLTDDGQFSATFGFLQLQTSVENIDHTEVTGPHRWYTAVGARLSLADDGLTFGTNHHLGLCVEFVEKIPRVIGPRAQSIISVVAAVTTPEWVCPGYAVNSTVSPAGHRTSLK